MSLDLTGIKNENEYYSHHYVSAILEGDLKDLFKGWYDREEKEGIKTPPSRLNETAGSYFAILKRKGLSSGEKQDELVPLLLGALEFPFTPSIRDLEGGGKIHLLSEITRKSGAPELWIIDALASESEETDPLERVPGSRLLDEEALKVHASAPLETLITKQIFGRPEPPRFVIVVSMEQILLIDRMKWTNKRILRFDLQEIFSRRETSTLKAMAALLHRDSLVPETGICLLDTLDENAHKHAFGVSEDLKYALRESIELLGNEAIYYIREVRKEGVFSGRIDAENLSLECLRYMYRLLFLFYIEARPELGFVPSGSEAYQTGYSLEALRELEMVHLTTEASRNGYYYHESLGLVFSMIWNGFSPAPLRKDAVSRIHTFDIKPLKAHLFDPDRLPLLSRIRFRNQVLQQVIRNMSLGRETTGRNGRRGRISYAQLGIHQLGAVYEALLCYRGFFAEEDLFEVKRAKDPSDVLATAYFVKEADLVKYTEDEKVYDDNGRLICHPKGEFIYRMSGRDREKSASYYTPEVLTRCLVKYALKELLDGKSADEILSLTVCEPAMGSAAFLNEAVNQLADAYMERKQKERGEILAASDYTDERQKVKLYMADNNCFGIDLNPVAVELAEVSLWLNVIARDAHVPWFGNQLVCGNSLIGARRQVFDEDLLRKGKEGLTWKTQVPERVLPGKKRKDHQVYHFLVPDSGMAAYKDKQVKDLVPDQIKAISSWKRTFTTGYSPVELSQLKKLSDAVDRLFAEHVKHVRELRKATRDPLAVYGQAEAKGSATSVQDKDRLFERIQLAQGLRKSSPYLRLKMAMDYWCALWFWPIEQADLLPSREEYVHDLINILLGGVFDSVPMEQMTLNFETKQKPASFKQGELPFSKDLGLVDVNTLIEKFPRLKLVDGVARRLRFLHWDLEFADILEDRGGFDLILGNPPWLKVLWNEGGIMGDVEPEFVIRKFSASSIAALRKEVIDKFGLRSAYIKEYEEAEGVQSFLKATQNYPDLEGIQTNLYKCFLPQAWNWGKNVFAFVHPEGVYEDTNGGIFRKQLYSRLKYHFQIQNQLILFPIGHRERFSINIYGKIGSPNFLSMSNIIHPSTIENSLNHDGNGIVPGLKNCDNKWNISGHRSRILKISKDELKLFSDLYETSTNYKEYPQLPSLHLKEFSPILRKFSTFHQKIEQIKEQYSSYEMWHETNAQNTGTIRVIQDFLTNYMSGLFQAHIFI